MDFGKKGRGRILPPEKAPEASETHRFFPKPGSVPFLLPAACEGKAFGDGKRPDLFGKEPRSSVPNAFGGGRFAKGRSPG